MEAGRGAAMSVPAAIESAAAWTRERRVAGTRLAKAGFGTYRTTPLASPKASTLGRNVPAFTSWPPGGRPGAGR